MDSNLPIGVFDSGMGGLTVLKALTEHLPNESFIYLGDTARLPYGTKSPETVRLYAVQMARILVEQNIKALVIACNTATTAALPYLKEMLPDLIVLGVVEPGAKAAVSASKNGRVFVMATETTLAAKAYHKEIFQIAPDMKVNGRACSLMVALAEEGLVNHDITKLTLLHYLETLTDEDTLVLGCTHFPVFKSLLKTLLPATVTMVDSAEATAKTLVALFDEYQGHTSNNNHPSISYFVTDGVERFSKVGSLFLGKPIAISEISLVDVVPSKEIR